jgi:hypothetical protein
MPAGKAGFAAGLIEGLGGAFVEQRKQKHDAELRGQEQLTNLYLTAISQGDLDPQIGFPLIAQIIGGNYAHLKGEKPGKGGKGKGGIIDQLMDPTNLSSFMMGLHGASKGPKDTRSGQGGLSGDNAGSPESRTTDASGGIKLGGGSIFRSRQQKRDEEFEDYKNKERFKTDEGIRSANETGRYKKPTNWSTDTTVGADLKGGLKEDILGNPIDPKKSYKVRELPDGTIEARPTEFTSNKARNDNSKLGQMTKRIQVLNPEMSPEEAQKQAALRLEAEDKMSKDQKVGRYNAYLRSANNTANLSGERLREMKIMFPLHETATRAGIDLTNLRISQADVRTPQAAAKVLEQFTKTAQQIRDKRTMIGELTDAYPIAASTQEIADQLLLEAGQDPNDLRAVAKDAYKKPEKKDPTPSSITTPGGSFVPIQVQ